MNTPNPNKLIHTLCFDISLFAMFLLFRSRALRRLVVNFKHPVALAILGYETKAFKYSPDIINQFYLPRFAIYQFLSLATSYAIPDALSYLTPIAKAPLVFGIFLNRLPGVMPALLGVGALGTFIKYWMSKELSELL